MAAKLLIFEADRDLPQKKKFPLEPICCYVGRHKVISDSEPLLQFWAHKPLAWQILPHCRSSISLPGNISQLLFRRSLACFNSGHVNKFSISHQRTTFGQNGLWAWIVDAQAVSDVSKLARMCCTVTRQGKWQHCTKQLRCWDSVYAIWELTPLSQNASFNMNTPGAVRP